MKTHYILSAIIILTSLIMATFGTGAAPTPDTMMSHVTETPDAMMNPATDTSGAMMTHATESPDAMMPQGTAVPGASSGSMEKAGSALRQ